MKSTVNKSAFMDAFSSMDRYNQFGYEGLSVLFDYLEEYEDSAGEEIELDVIALCCDYSHDSIEDIAANYDIDLSDCDDDEAKREAVEEYLNENTTICGSTDSGFVYCSAF